MIDDQVLAQVQTQALDGSFSIKELSREPSALDLLTLQLTYHTNTIEGSTMTLGDVEAVLFDDRVLTNRTAIEQREAQNHRAALMWLIDRLNSEGKAFEFTDDLLEGLHVRLMNGIIANAGMYRNHNARILGVRVPLANYHSVPQKIDDLLYSLNSPSNDLIREMAVTHAQFEQIHPFTDGNGRCGRLLLFAQAARMAHYPPIVIKERKKAYYRYLEHAQLTGDTQPLQQFIAESMLFTTELLSSFGR
jgi:Fic family protein